MSMDIGTALRLLNKYEACSPAMRWVEGNTSVQDAWEKAPSRTWSYWLILKLTEDPGVVNPVELYLKPMLKVAREIIAATKTENPIYEAAITEYAALYEKAYAEGRIGALPTKAMDGLVKVPPEVFGDEYYASEACRRVLAMADRFIEDALPFIYHLREESGGGTFVEQEGRAHKRFVHESWPAIEACLERAALQRGLVEALPSKEE
jgi:hypothetical protein